MGHRIEGVMNLERLISKLARIRAKQQVAAMRKARNARRPKNRTRTARLRQRRREAGARRVDCYLSPPAVDALSMLAVPGESVSTTLSRVLVAALDRACPE